MEDRLINPAIKAFYKLLTHWMHFHQGDARYKMFDVMIWHRGILNLKMYLKSFYATIRYFWIYFLILWDYGILRNWLKFLVGAIKIYVESFYDRIFLKFKLLRVKLSHIPKNVIPIKRRIVERFIHPIKSYFKTTLSLAPYSQKIISNYIRIWILSRLQIIFMIYITGLTYKFLTPRNLIL